MSQLTHPRVQTVDLSFKFRKWLAVPLAIAALAIPTVLVISSDDDSGQSTQAAASAGLRYDGGPEEGTTALNPAGPRYDGGPDEGTAALNQGESSTPQASSDVFGRRP
jgi:hypothetical protein